MGIIDRGLEKAHERQRQSLITEAQRAGCTILSIQESGDQEKAEGAAVGTSLKAIFGGKVGTDTVQVMLLETMGMKHLYVQPYSGVSPLPGEHHAVLGGSLPAVLELTPGGFSPEWKSPDKELSKALNKSFPVLKAAAKKCQFEWAVGFGTVKLEWAIQVASLGDGRSHMVMQAGRYGGLTTYEVGFSHFMRMYNELSGAMRPERFPRQGFAHPVSFAAVFEQMVLGKAGAASVAAAAAAAAGAAPATAAAARAASGGSKPADFTDRIRQAALPLEGKKVHVQSIPEKKERSARQFVLPPEAKDAKIVALFDETSFGSAKDAVVLTPTHLYAHELGTKASFPLADLKAVKGFEGALMGGILVDVETLGTLKIPCAADEDLLKVLKTLADG